MKILLTLFVLLFSSSVVAGDDLSKKSIICGKINENKILVIQGYDFISNVNAEIYFYDNLDDKVKIVPDNDFKYETNLSQIKIIRFLDKSKKHLSKKYTVIDRETLQVSWYDGTEISILYKGNSNNCKVRRYENIIDNLNEIKKELIQELTKNNKI